MSGHRFPWSDVDTITHSRANYDSSANYPYDVSPTPGYHPTYKTGEFPYTSPVGSFAANGYGLFDLAGNVWEWCWDWDGPYASGSQTDPRGPASGSSWLLLRVVRGGGWDDDATICRASFRNYSELNFRYFSFGFRSVLPQG